MLFSYIIDILKTKMTDNIDSYISHFTKKICALCYLNSLTFEKAGKNKPNDTQASKEQSNTYLSGLYQARTKIWQLPEHHRMP